MDILLYRVIQHFRRASAYNNTFCLLLGSRLSNLKFVVNLIFTSGIRIFNDVLILIKH